MKTPDSGLFCSALKDNDFDTALAMLRDAAGCARGSNGERMTRSIASKQGLTAQFDAMIERERSKRVRQKPRVGIE